MRVSLTEMIENKEKERGLRLTVHWKTLPKQLKDLEAKFALELLKCWKKSKVTAEYTMFTCKSGTEAVRFLHSWNTMISNKCKNH